MLNAKKSVLSHTRVKTVEGWKWRENLEDSKRKVTCCKQGINDSFNGWFFFIKTNEGQKRERVDQHFQRTERGRKTDQ
jgi:hypothetical protein